MKTKLASIHTDVYVGAIMTLAGGILFYMALGMPAIPKRFACIVTGLFIALSIAILVRGVKMSLEAKDDWERVYQWVRIKYPFLFFLFLAMYVILIDSISFFPATSIFVPGLMFFLKVRSWKVIVFSTVLIDVSMWFIFVNQLKIIMP
ncbi:MAG TPA: tripartite tricarboxylate transporter TctB family protein [Bacillota bacterium]|nr:tripartite tricarboxylate transporter TctB family protein [Bacillota bacterium]